MDSTASHPPSQSVPMLHSGPFKEWCLDPTKSPKGNCCFLSLPTYGYTMPALTPHSNGFNLTCNSVLRTSIACLGPSEPVSRCSSALLPAQQFLSGPISSQAGCATVPSTWKPLPLTSSWVSGLYCLIHNFS